MHVSQWYAQWYVVDKQYSSAVVMRGTALDDLEIVAKAYSIEGQTDVEIANLISAGPDMYEALRNLAYTTQAMSAYIPVQNAKLRDEYFANTQSAYKAIRKAEGRSE